jgi:hypothetical protein
MTNNPLEVPTEEMLRIKRVVLEKLVARYHEHRILARAVRKLGNIRAAQLEEREAENLKLLIHSLDDPEHPVRLLED